MAGSLSTHLGLVAILVVLRVVLFVLNLDPQRFFGGGLKAFSRIKIYSRDDIQKAKHRITYCTIAMSTIGLLFVMGIFLGNKTRVDEHVQCKATVDPDIAGFGARVAVWVQICLLMLVSLLGTLHWKTPTGIKDIGAGLLVTHVFLAVATVINIDQGRFTPLDAVICAMILDAQNIAISIHIPMKETLAARWQVRISIIGQTFGLDVVGFVVARLSNGTFVTTNCACFSAFWWGWIGTCANPAPKMFWFYYAYRWISFCDSAFYIFKVKEFHLGEKGEKNAGWCWEACTCKKKFPKQKCKCRCQHRCMVQYMAPLLVAQSVPVGKSSVPLQLPSWQPFVDNDVVGPAVKGLPILGPDWKELLLSRLQTQLRLELSKRLKPDQLSALMQLDDPTDWVAHHRIDYERELVSITFCLENSLTTNIWSAAGGSPMPAPERQLWMKRLRKLFSECTTNPIVHDEYRKRFSRIPSTASSMGLEYAVFALCSMITAELVLKEYQPRPTPQSYTIGQIIPMGIAGWTMLRSICTTYWMFLQKDEPTSGVDQNLIYCAVIASWLVYVLVKKFLCCTFFTCQIISRGQEWHACDGRCQHIYIWNKERESTKGTQYTASHVAEGRHVSSGLALANNNNNLSSHGMQPSSAPDIVSNSQARTAEKKLATEERISSMRAMQPKGYDH
ncbi:hypothetical protein K440DRAFT_679801 [Wilcoxina mikolae CBS 423.85]|nr:hypothetical protein K440DRAFT_679801 [Wilcoxina mikolae CBS 423.85]